MEPFIHPRERNDSYLENAPHITRLPNTSISHLANFGALIISIIFVVYFVIRFYVLEGFFLRRIYGTTYTQMNEVTRRGFVNHHIAGATKILSQFLLNQSRGLSPHGSRVLIFPAVLIVAAYPFIDVAFGSATFHSSFAGSKYVTQGDVLIVTAQMLIGGHSLNDGLQFFYLKSLLNIFSDVRIRTVLQTQNLSSQRRPSHWNNNDRTIRHCYKSKLHPRERCNYRIHSLHNMG